MGSLLQLLERKTGTPQRARDALAGVAERLGTPGDGPSDEVMAGLALCARGEPPESVSKHLNWKDFEKFCSMVLRAKGYRVRENLHLRKPRAQIDILGVSARICLAVDCKHWRRTPGRATLARLVAAQRARAKRLHDTLDPIGPIATVILVLTDPGERFVEGGAIVPVFALGDFLDGVESHREMLDLV
ncbi:MAG: restriction endonuclease [Nitrososphaerota archaeon]|nr:restriction endonuclease [Nitrososphaerota archaeon]